MISVIMSGGSGIRLWPYSSGANPKPLIELFGEPLLRSTFKRLRKSGPIHILTRSDLERSSKKVLRGLIERNDRFVLEPFGCNTASAIGVHVQMMLSEGRGREVVAYVPADHWISNEKIFSGMLKVAGERAQNGELVTIGVRPSYPATGYGYIQCQKKKSLISSHRHGISSVSVEKFFEKPQLNTAKQFLRQKHFLWNAGIFVGQVQTFAKHFAKQMPSNWRKIQKLKTDNSNIQSIYKTLKSVSFDHGVMEKLREGVSCVSGPLDWMDLGSWEDVEKCLKHQAPHLGSPIAQKVAAVLSNGQSNFCFSTIKRPILVQGLDNIMVIDTELGLLIMKRGEGQNIKNQVERLELLKRRKKVSANEV